MRAMLIVTTFVVGLTGCGGQGDGRRATDTLGVAPVEAIGATAVPAALRSTHPLVGAWRLERTDPRGGAGPGIMITLNVDSVRGETAHGRLTHYMAGNAGGDPAAWGALTGSVRRDSVRLHVPGDGDRVGDLEFAGVLVADTIRLSRFQLGPDDLAADAPARWLLVRTSSR